MLRDILFKILNGILCFFVFIIIILWVINGYLVINEDNHDFSVNSINIESDDKICMSIDVNKNSPKTSFNLLISSPKIFCDKESLKKLDFTKLIDVSSVTVGDTIVYQLTYVGDVSLINLYSGHIGLAGFTGTKKSLNFKLCK